MVPAEIVGRAEKAEGRDKLVEDTLENGALDESLALAVEITTFTNSVAPKNRCSAREVMAAPSLVGPLGVRNGSPAEEGPSVGCSVACELSLLKSVLASHSEAVLM